MSFKKAIHVVTISLLALFAVPALGAGTLTAGPFTFEYDPSTEDGNTDLLGLSSGDAVFEITWYYRLEGDSAETSFTNPDSEVYEGDTATLTWQGVGGLFDATIVFVLVNAGPDQLQLNATVEVTALTDLAIDVIYYIDVDLAGDSSGDMAELINSPDYLRITDEDDPAVFNLLASGNSAYQVLEYSDLQDLLLDDMVTDLDNTGAPFGPEDFTGAFQWDTVDLARGERARYGVSAAGNSEPSMLASGVRPAVSIPTLGNVGLGLMFLLLLGYGLLVHRRMA